MVKSSKQGLPTGKWVKVLFQVIVTNS